MAEGHDNNEWVKGVEFWDCFINYFIASLIGYYFVVSLWPELSAGQRPDVSLVDFVLFIAFLLGVFGHLAVLSNNITNGIQAILKRVLIN